MDTQESAAFPLREAYPFADQNGLGAEAAEIRDLNIEWGKRNDSRIRRGRMIRLFERHGLMGKFIENHWQNGATPQGESRRLGCLRIAEEYDQFLANGEIPDLEETEAKSSFEFALEAHLRDFLAKNLDQIEPGLKLYDRDGIRGVEYAIEAGFIDILAVDAKGALVPIELKLSKGRNRALGQLLYYMGWIDQNLGNGPCRGIVIASEISDELAVAASRAPGVSLYRYKMNFTLEPAGATAV